MNVEQVINIVYSFIATVSMWIGCGIFTLVIAIVIICLILHLMSLLDEMFISNANRGGGKISALLFLILFTFMCGVWTHMLLFRYWS